MSSVMRRLRALEKNTTHQPARLIVVNGEGETSDEEVTAILAREGITVTQGDDLVVFITLYELQGGGVANATKPPQLVSVTPLNNGRR